MSQGHADTEEVLSPFTEHFLGSTLQGAGAGHESGRPGPLDREGLSLSR